jgi:TolA-binding protein
MKPILAALLVFAALLAAPPARAQLESREAIELRNQILELRRDVQSLREQIGRGGGGGSVLGGSSRPAPAPAGGGEMTAALLDRVLQLEDQVRLLRGRIDEEENGRKRQGDDLKKDLDDLNFKLGAGAPPPSSSPPPKPLGTLPATPPATTPAAPGALRRTPEVAMQEGNAALARRDYAQAEAAAREVLAFPRSPRAADAQFLLAQALNGKKDFQAAAIAYDDSYNRARTGSHAQDSLLGLANALNSIGEKRAACATLDKLRAEFPALRADLRDSVAGARQRAGCK